MKFGYTPQTTNNALASPFNFATGVNDITFQDITFKGNTSTNGYGGAAYIKSGENFSFRNAVFHDNKAMYGGAVSLSAYASDTLKGVDFTGAEFKNNKALMEGGGIAIANDVSNLTFHNVNFINNAAAYGGAIATESSLTISGKSLFSGNTAPDGGAISLERNSIVTFNPNQSETVEFAQPLILSLAAGIFIKLARARQCLAAMWI